MHSGRLTRDDGRTEELPASSGIDETGRTEVGNRIGFLTATTFRGTAWKGLSRAVARRSLAARRAESMHTLGTPLEHAMWDYALPSDYIAVDSSGVLVHAKGQCGRGHVRVLARTPAVPFQEAEHHVSRQGTARLSSVPAGRCREHIQLSLHRLWLRRTGSNTQSSLRRIP
jgi:hypothetical protein